MSGQSASIANYWYIYRYCSIWTAYMKKIPEQVLNIMKDKLSSMLNMTEESYFASFAQAQLFHLRRLVILLLSLLFYFFAIFFRHCIVVSTTSVMKRWFTFYVCFFDFEIKTKHSYPTCKHR